MRSTSLFLCATVLGTLSAAILSSCGPAEIISTGATGTGGLEGTTAATSTGGAGGGLIDLPDGGGSGGTGGGCEGDGCSPVAFCGDGKIDPGEKCDDTNSASGDGCSPDCLVEKDFACPTPGALCVSTVVCGDGKVNGTETCDDHNTKVFDRQGGFRQVRTLNHQLAVGHREPSAGRRELHGLADHCSRASVVGGADAPDGVDGEL